MILGSAKEVVNSIVSMVLSIKEVLMDIVSESSNGGGSPLLWRNVEDVFQYFARDYFSLEYQA